MKTSKRSQWFGVSWVNLTLLILIVSRLSSLAQPAQIKPVYETIKNPNPDAWTKELILMKSLTISVSKSNVVQLNRIKSNGTEWKISAGKNQGTIQLIQEREKQMHWVYNLRGQTYKIHIFSGFNDPREFVITDGKDSLFVLNLEPDCNSSFELYKQTNTTQKPKTIALATASSPCKDTAWKLKWLDKIDEHQQVCFLFLATVSMTVRAMPDLIFMENK
ncbi:MAG: hypothetical protein NZ108_03905 [Bacteroidia bacterium]|nr:hypothetical protein [Bacteroidia bacterium]